jgi:hypothetical protein
MLERMGTLRTTDAPIPLNLLSLKKRIYRQKIYREGHSWRREIVEGIGTGFIDTLPRRNAGSTTGSTNMRSEKSFGELNATSALKL